MDRDDYFRILEETSCYNMENFVFDREWANLSALSHNTKKDYGFPDQESPEKEQKGNKNFEKNVLKFFK